MNGLADSLNVLALELGPQDAATKKALAGKEPSELNKTIVEARVALKNIDNAAGQLSKLVSDSKGPVKNFTETGLTELSMTIRELRQLTANLNVIATRLERDPAGLRVQRQAGIYAEMMLRLAASRRRPPCSLVASSSMRSTRHRPTSIR